MTKIAISEFQVEDQKVLAPIYLEQRKETFHWIDADFQLLDFEKDTHGEVIYVAKTDHKPVGFVSIWMADNFIHNLYIDSDYKKMGVGKKLLEHALKNMGRPASLKCVVRNENAVSFYKHLGWKIKETKADGWGPYYLFHFE